MELMSLVGVVMLSVGLSLAGARAMLAAGLFLMVRAAAARRGRSFSDMPAIPE
jgi:hypothetical protein